MKANRAFVFGVLLGTCCTAMAWTSARGLDYTWNAGSGEWGTAANWNPSTGVPGDGDVVLLTNGGTIDLGGNRTVAGVGAIGTGNGIVGTLTNGSLYFTNNMYVKFGTVGVNLSNLGGSTGRLWIGGNDAATVVLTGVNTHTYQDNYATIIGHSTTGAAGTVMLGNNSALGGSTNRTDVYSGKLDLNGQNAVVQNQIRLMSSNLASLINDNTLANAGTAAEIVMSASNSIGGDGNLSLGGVVSGGGNLTKIGTGMLTLSGANTFTGQITVAAGTLSINSWNTSNSNGPLGNSSSKVILGGAGNTGTLQYTGGIINAGVNLRGIQVDEGESGIVHLAFDAPSVSKHIHIPGGQLDIRGSLTIDARDGTTVPNGDTLRRRMIVTSPESASLVFPGQLTVAQHTELQLSPPVATPFNFGSGTITVNEGGILSLYATATGGANATVTLGGLAGAGLVRGDASGLKTYRIGSNDDSTEFSGVIANGRAGATVALTKVGEGTLTLSGVNTFSGPLRVEEGVLALSGTNTFTGPITVAEGTLSITSWNADNTPGPLGQSSSKVVLGGAGTTGTLEFTATGGYGTARRGIELAEGGTGMVHLTPATGTRSTNYIHIAGTNITGSGAFVVDTSHGTTQTSRLIITSDTSITGPVTVNAYSELQGYLSSGDKPFGTGTVTVKAHGILNVFHTANATATLGGLAGEGRVHAEGGGAKTIRIGINNESTAFSGVIANNAANSGDPSVAVTKIGTGTLTLSGANVFSGPVTVENGTLSIGTWNNNNVAGPLGQSSNKVQLDGGAIRYTGGSIGPNKSLHMAGAGTVDVVNAATVLNLGAAGSNSLTGNGDITKEGLGTLQLAQANVAQSTWGGKLIINAGTVDFFGSDSMPKPASFVPDAIQINDGGTFAFSHSGTSPSGSSPNANIGFQLSGNAGLAITAGTHALQGVIANKPGQTGNLIKGGGGTLALSGNNTFGGQVTVAEGTLSIGTWNNNNVAGPLGQSANKVQLDDGAIRYTGGSIGPNKSLNMAGAGTVDVVNAATVLNLGAAGSNSLTGNGDITKEGLGTLQLAQASVGQWTWGGKLIINEGRVEFWGGGSMPVPDTVVPDAIQINDGATFGLSYAGDSTIPTNGGFQLSGHATVFVNSHKHTYAGIITDKLGETGNLVKSGGGTLALSGDNTFGGQLTVAAGTLSISSWTNDNTPGPLGQSSSKVVLGGAGTTGTLEYTGILSNSPSTLRGIELATGGVGKVQLSSAGTTRSNHYVHLSGSKIVGSGELTIDTSYNGVYTSRFIIVGDAAITGPVTVNPHSELQNSLASAGDNTPFGTGTITVSANGILNLFRNASDATAILGGLAGAGRVHAEGSGVKTFKIGANDESTVFSGGIQNGSATHVAVTKFGEGTLTLSGTNTFTGATNVEKGTLLVNGSLTGTSGVTVNDGATLGGSGAITATVAGEGWISPGNSAGILTVDSIEPSGGLSARFEFGKTESPIYSNAADSINDVLRIAGQAPISGPLTTDNVIDVYFGITPSLGDVFRGGVYVDVAGDPQGLAVFYDAVADATYNYYVHDGGGYVPFSQYAPEWWSVAVSTVAEAAAFGGGGPVSGGVMQFTLVPEPGALLMLLAACAMGLLFRPRRGGSR